MKQLSSTSNEINFKLGTTKSFENRPKPHNLKVLQELTPMQNSVSNLQLSHRSLPRSPGADLQNL